MKPLNLDNKPCSPISSNCVVWQGPDIPCINLCTGDTVSDVVSAMATELCTILDTLKVSNYDLTCFNLQACGPEDFQSLIQFLITRICELEGVAPEVKDESTCPDCVVSVAECFVTGTQTTMQLVDYVQLIGQRLCSLITEISLINTQITDILIRLTDLENAPAPTFTLPEFTLGCTIGALTGDQAIDTVLIEFINNVWCGFYAETGTTSELNAAGNQKCIVDADRQLNTGTAFSANPNWILDASYDTVADAINNIWVVLCDVWNWADGSTFNIEILDEGITLTTEVSSIDFVGDGVTASVIGNDVTVTIPGSSQQIPDTGWVDLNGFSWYTGATSQGFIPQCRRIGNVIHFRGVIYVPLGIADGNIVALDILDGTYGETNMYTTVGESVVNSNALGIQWNNGNRVVPANVLDPGESIDGTYRAPFPSVLSRRFSQDGTVAGDGLTLTAAGRIGVTTDGNIYFQTLTDQEFPSGLGTGIPGHSSLRMITSNVRSGDFIPLYTNANSDINSFPGPAGTEPVQTETTSGLVTYPFNCDGGDGDQLGGFWGTLDGLTAFVACDSTPATEDCYTP